LVKENGAVSDYGMFLEVMKERFLKVQVDRWKG